MSEQTPSQDSPSEYKGIPHEELYDTIQKYEELPEDGLDAVVEMWDDMLGIQDPAISPEQLWDYEKKKAKMKEQGTSFLQGFGD